ncbi:sporulation-induced protein [Coemansia sp. RSA 1853]|nr:sporulation-induced protein [Coemansia sp. RSA 638]KAJ2538477.1 sporulation-induced protein [Coemansia sp. RSA 1853]
MLWRFGLQHASNIDKLLEKEDLTLEEVLNDPDLQQEIREQNPKVISYLVQPQNLKQMVDYIATEEFFKFTKMAATACEVLCSPSAAFAEALAAAYVSGDFVESDSESESDSSAARAQAGERRSTTEEPRQHLLEQLWSIMRLDNGQLDAQQASQFSRVMCSLLQRKPYEALDFIRAQDAAVAQFLEHLNVSAVVDLLLKVISLEELENGPGIIEWLSSQQLVAQLVARLAPDQDPEMHSLAAQVLLDIIAISQCNNPAQPTIGTNALIEELKSEATVSQLAVFMLDRTAPHATSTLINCVYIFIELIRRNYSDMDGDGEVDEDEEYVLDGVDDDEDDEARPRREPRMPTVDLSDMMRVLALRVGDLVALLTDPRASTTPVPTTQGLSEPLGFERLRICELFAELLHCSNMPRLNAAAATGDGSDSPTVALEIGDAADHDTSNTPVGQLLKWKLIQHSVLPICTDLFFRFSLNNFLHSVVYDIMHQVLNLPLALECNVALIVVAFRDVRITSRIAQASAENDEAARAPRGVRRGYMGHLSGIGEEVARLLELSGAALEPLISPYIDGDEWLDYVARTLQEAREREQQPLGGERPGAAYGGSPVDGADVDMLATDAAGQVFVSRMGLVDARAGDAYGTDDEDLDDEDDEGPHGHLMYPNNEDDDEDSGPHSSLYFSRKPTETAFGLRPSVDDDEDQFIIRDIDDDEDEYCSAVAADDIGPAGRMGRFRSYQNEPTPVASSDEEDNAGDNDETSASSEPTPKATSRATPELTRERTPDGSSDDQGNEGCTIACSDYKVVDDGAGCAPLPAVEDVELIEARKTRRQLLRLSLDGSTHTVAADLPDGDDTALPALPAYLLALPDIPSPTTETEVQEPVLPPPMPPRPSDADCASFKNNLTRLAAQNPAIKLPSLVSGPSGPPEPKGRLQDLLYRESKQRSLSSSELDNIVPSDIGSWGAPGSTEDRRGSMKADSSVEAEGGESTDTAQAGTFAARRRRSRSQSAGVGISRAMVIQAAVQGQFPYLDAKTCQFVGQLKTDTVTLGGAAASSSARPRSKPIPPLLSSPTMNPEDVPPVPLRPSTLPPSNLRLRSSAIASDSDDDDEALFPPIPLLPPTLHTLPTPVNSNGTGRVKPIQQSNIKSEKSSSLTYAAVAMSASSGVAMSASNGVSALPTPSIVTTLPSYPTDATAKPQSMSWAAVVSSSSAETPAANGRSGRNRGQRSTSKGTSRVPSFPMLPMSPVGKETPPLFTGKK